jgi:hypothetical protein
MVVLIPSHLLEQLPERVSTSTALIPVSAATNAAILAGVAGAGVDATNHSAAAMMSPGWSPSSAATFAAIVSGPGANADSTASNRLFVFI